MDVNPRSLDTTVLLSGTQQLWHGPIGVCASIPMLSVINTCSSIYSASAFEYLFVCCSDANKLMRCQTLHSITSYTNKPINSKALCVYHIFSVAAPRWKKYFSVLHNPEGFFVGEVHTIFAHLVFQSLK